MRRSPETNLAISKSLRRFASMREKVIMMIKSVKKGGKIELAKKGKGGKEEEECQRRTVCVCVWVCERAGISFSHHHRGRKGGGGGEFLLKTRKEEEKERDAKDLLSSPPPPPPPPPTGSWCVWGGVGWR